MDNTMTPRLVELVRADLEWIRKVADAQYEGDPKLRSDAARTLIRISDRASEAISRLMAEGGLSKEPLRPLGPEVEMDLARIIAKNLGDTFELAFLSKSSWTHARGKAVDGSFRDINAPLQSDYRNAARAAIALLQANEVKRPSNPVDDGAVERGTLGPTHIKLLRRGASATWIWLADDAGTHAMEIIALGQLERAGLVEIAVQGKPLGPPTFPPRRITEAGRAALEAAEPHP